MPNGKRESLGPSDWAEAALDALARGGITAVAVEPLAKALKTTKGSFYWHFADRNALLAATLELWEQRDTERVIANLDATQDAQSRLRRLLRLTFTAVADGSAGSTGTVELALQASAAQPLVSNTLNRVTKRRLALLTELYLAAWTLPGPCQRPCSARLHRLSRPCAGSARHAGPPATRPRAHHSRRPDRRHSGRCRPMSRQGGRPPTRRGCRLCCDLAPSNNTQARNEGTASEAHER